MPSRKSKKIILLSDGTGNSAISRDKSNVWRLFQALDQGRDKTGFQEQIAFYDDGVGTSGFRPLKILGGVFGYGLSQNVRDLYTELCRHYQPGDQVYIFGFSRGAFTARVLAHFIGVCGIVDPSQNMPVWPNKLTNLKARRHTSGHTDKGFKRAISKAYKSYRQSYWNRKGYSHPIPKCISWALRLLRHSVLRSHVPTAAEFKAHFSYDLDALQSPQKPIEFIGVWDTVDALGLPISELSDYWDKHFYPYKFKNQILGNYVARAAQALAIDDERHTFHPLLWDQSSIDDKKRITQVWFTGMHSNVGGGYPEDGLAHIALNWMYNCSKQQQGDTETGLKLIPEKLADIRKHASPFAKMYDSRRGVGVFYRYKPRNIHKLCHNEKLTADPVIVHRSVLERIGDKNAGYAPAGIPDDFDLCDENGNISQRDHNNPYHETKGQSDHRGKFLSRAEDLISWGRVAYFCMLGVGLALVAFPLVYPGIPGWEINFTEYGDWSALLSPIAHALSWINFDYISYWVDAWQLHIIPFLVLVGLFVVFFTWAQLIKQNVQKLAEMGWDTFRDQGKDQIVPKQKFLSKLSHYLRTSSSVQSMTGIFKQTVFPAVFFALLFTAGGTAILRNVDTPFTAQIDPCHERTLTMPVDVLKYGTPASINFDVKSPCIETGIDVEAGRLYSVKFDTQKRWMDASFPANNRGLEKPLDSLKLPFPIALPIKRHITLPWFALTAQIGRNSSDRFPINRNEFTFKANVSGPLYLYVNDAINVLKLPKQRAEWDIFYENNIGTGRLEVTKIKKMQ